MGSIVLQTTQDLPLPVPVPDQASGVGYEQRAKEFAKEAARYSIDTVAKNAALSYIGGQVFFGEGTKYALLTGIFFGTIFPLTKLAHTSLKNRVSGDISKFALEAGLTITDMTAMALFTLAMSDKNVDPQSSFKYSPVPIILPYATYLISQAISQLPYVFCKGSDLIKTKDTDKNEDASLKETDLFGFENFKEMTWLRENLLEHLNLWDSLCD